MTQLDLALADLEKAQRTVQELLTTAKRFPEEYPIGTVLAFRKKYRSYSKDYGFVALRAADGRWYLSSSYWSVDKCVFTWDGLVGFIGDGPCSIAQTWKDV